MPRLRFIGSRIALTKAHFIAVRGIVVRLCDEAVNPTYN